MACEIMASHVSWLWCKIMRCCLGDGMRLKCHYMSCPVLFCSVRCCSVPSCYVTLCSAILCYIFLWSLVVCVMSCHAHLGFHDCVQRRAWWIGHLRGSRPVTHLSSHDRAQDTLDTTRPQARGNPHRRVKKSQEKRTQSTMQTQSRHDVSVSVSV